MSSPEATALSMTVEGVSGLEPYCKPKSSAMVSLDADHVLVATLGVGADYFVSIPLWCGNHHPHPTHGALVNHRLRPLLNIGFEVL